MERLNKIQEGLKEPDNNQIERQGRLKQLQFTQAIKLRFFFPKGNADVDEVTFKANWLLLEKRMAEAASCSFCIFMELQ